MSTQSPGQAISSNIMGKLNHQYSGINESLGKSSLIALNRMQKQEADLKAQLAKKDSSRAAQLFAGSGEMYASLRSKLNTVSGAGTPVNSLNSYIPKLDSMNTAMHFLEGAGAGNLQQVQAISGNLQQLQGRLQAAGDIQQFLRQREQQLKDQLASYGLGKKLLGMNKTVYYYQQQVAQYKAMLTDKQKYQDAALNAIRESPAIQSFMAKHSWLSQLFPAPAASGTSVALVGSQTASSVEDEMKQRLGGLSTNPMGYMKQQVGSSEGQIDQVQSKLASVGSLVSGPDATMPDFTPNTQKTKTFQKRLEFGFNIQSQKTSYLLPTISSLALTAGYKLSDKATVGVGASYNIGWGNSIDHIRVSSQGVSFRSYVDIKAKGNFWITGGL
jgi:hypothetical protein